MIITGQAEESAQQEADGSGSGNGAQESTAKESAGGSDKGDIKRRRSKTKRASAGQPFFVDQNNGNTTEKFLEKVHVQ